MAVHSVLAPKSDIQAMASQVITAIGQNNLVVAAQVLHALAEDHGFPVPWLRSTACALQIGEWSRLCEGYLNQDFVGPDGQFLIVGPYRVLRGGEASVRMSAVWGQVIPLGHPLLGEMGTLLQEVFGTLKQPVARVLPIHIHACAGNIGGPEGEPFVVPQWAFADNCGPVLNDLKAQRRRHGSITRVIQHLCTPETAKLILGALEDEQAGTLVQHVDYTLHEAGHASGLGLEFKSRHGLLPGYWYAAVEEARSDGVGLELVARSLMRGSLSETQAGKLAAANLCIRLGADGLREGGTDRDHDVNTAILIFDRLLESGHFYLNNRFELGLREPSYANLFRATEPLRAEALTLTRKELALKHPDGLLHLYGSVQIPQASRVLFEALMDRCRH